MGGVIAPLVASLAAAWAALLLVAPLLPTVPAALTYAAASVVCHQWPARSFHLASAQLPVCARCLGIYVGVAVALWTAPGAPLSPSRARWTVAIGALPTAATVAAEWLGLWETSNAVRAAAGAPLGAGVGLVVRAALATRGPRRARLRGGVA
jgi:uncharacterized membrane protein